VTANNTSIVVDKQRKAAITGVPVFALEDEIWQRQVEENSQTIEIDEAPRVDLIFGDAMYTYGQPGVADLGDGDFLVFADAALLQHGVGGFGYDSEVHWALVSGADLQVKARGSVVYGVPDTAGSPRYPMAAGKYVCMWYGLQSIGIYEFNRTTCALELKLPCSFDTLTYSPGMQIDAAYDSVQDRILVCGPNAEYFWVDPSDWSINLTGTFAGVTPDSGTLGLSICSTITVGRTYVIWRVDDVYWYKLVATITDSGVTVTSAATSFWASYYALTEAGTNTPWQAKVTAWGNAAWTSYSEGAMVVIYDRPYDTAGFPSVQGMLVQMLSTGGVVAKNIAGFDFFGAIPATKPVVVPTESELGSQLAKGRCWGYMTSGRSLRAAVCLAESTRKYECNHIHQDKNYPRLVGMAFRAAEPAPVPIETLVGGTNALVRTETGIRGRSGWLAAMVAMRDAATTTHTKVYLVTQGDGAALETATGTALPDVLQQANANGVTLFATALPSQFGTKAEMTGSQYTARKPLVSENVTGSIPAGTYLYCVVRKWFDSVGNLMRSAVSEPTSVTSSSSGSFNVAIMDDPWENRQINTTQTGGYTDLLPGTITEIYRTTNAGSVFYLVTPNGIPTPGGQLLYDIYNDVTLDTAITANEILYTQGQNGGNSGMLDWWGCPPCRCIWAGFNRVIVGGLENARRAQLSNLFFPGEGLSFPANAAFYVDVPEDVTAVAAMDQMWLIFSANAIWAFNGAGPDSFGSGTFGDVLLLPSGVGARSWRSVVETPEGLMFQASNARIYCIQRGSLQVQDRSQAIRDSIGCAPTNVNGYQAGDGDTSDPTYWVIGAVYDKFANEVWFVDHLSRSWVYQLEFGAWREEVSTSDLGKTRISVGTIHVGDYVGPVFVTLDPTPVGSRCCRRSDSNTYLDRGSKTRFMGITTNDIDLVHGRIKRAWVKVHTEVDEVTTRFLPAKMHFWFDGLRNDQLPDESRSYALSLTTLTTRFLDEEFCPARQKCNQVRLTWSDVPTGVYANIANYVLGIELELEQSPKVRGSIRYAGGSNRGT
jgi:hypothetical protein